MEEVNDGFERVFSSCVGLFFVDWFCRCTFFQGRLSKMTVPELKSLARQFKLVVSSTGKKRDDIERLLDMGKSGKLERSTLADSEDSASFCLDKTEPELSLSLQDWLVRGAANSDDVRDHL